MGNPVHVLPSLDGLEERANKRSLYQAQQAYQSLLAPSLWKTGVGDGGREGEGIGAIVLSFPRSIKQSQSVSEALARHDIVRHLVLPGLA